MSDYFTSLIDDFGVWQHSDGVNLLLSEGYALDDAARGLLVCLTLNKARQAEVLFGYLAQSLKAGKVFGYSDSRRHFFGDPASEDATSQTLWGLGYALSKDFHAAEAKKLIKQLLPIVSGQTSLRGPAYGLLGAVYFDPKWSKSLARSLGDRFNDVDKAWLWPEVYLTYANAIIPYSLLRYSQVTGDHKYLKLGLEILEFVDHSCRQGRMLGPIGNNGWFKQGTSVAPTFSQQPIDAAYMVWAYICASNFDKSLHHKAVEWMGWFNGNNILNKSLINPKNNQCFDGLNPEGLNTHSGAESNICYLLADYMLKTGQTI